MRTESEPLTWLVLQGSHMSDFARSLELTFVEDHDANPGVAAAAAENAVAFREEYDLDISAPAFGSVVAEAPYDDFPSAFDYAIGDFAADIEDCTDSREFRMSGYDEFAADPAIGT